jgi:hypothetical protein
MKEYNVETVEERFLRPSYKIYGEKFRETKFLGKGGFGMVYQVKDIRTSKFFSLYF